MLGKQFYFGSIKKYTAIFGALFNDIKIYKNDAEGKVVSLEKIPLKNAMKDKMLLRFKEDPNLDRKVAIKLPVMSMEMTNIVRDEERQLSTTNRIAQKNNTDPNYFSTQFVPNPFDFHFSLYVYVKNMEDGTKIVEQILPFFKPEFTVSAIMIPELELEKRDIPISMVGDPVFTNIYDGTYDKRQVIMWQLDFVVKGYIWGPVEKTPVIKFVKTNIHMQDSNAVISSSTVQPGLTAGGEPTSNVSNSVDPLTIFVTDDYGIVEIDDE